MQRRMRTTALALSLAAILGLASCSSPPKPPTADESSRRPANDPARIELLKAQSELERARIELELQRRQAEVRRMTEEIQAAAVAPILVHAPLDNGAAATRGANTVYTVLFNTGGTRLSLTVEEIARLVNAAKESPLVVVRGRTDGEAENAADSRIARERAIGMRSFLIGAGVPADRIRVTYQPVGDHAANNQTADGRALNRRVEVELYSAAPTIAQLSPTRSPKAPAAQ